MKIVDRATFLEMAAGTLFAKYQPCCFDTLAIKEETSFSDFWVQDLVPWFEGVDDSGGYFDTLARMAKGVSSPPLDYDCTSRDGLFDAGQLFAVFERDDVVALIARLTRAISDTESVRL